MLYILAAIILGIALGRRNAYKAEFSHVSTLMNECEEPTGQISAYWRAFAKRQASDGKMFVVESLFALYLCAVNYYFLGWTFGPSL